MRIAACCMCILMPLLLQAQKKLSIASPDGNLVFNVYNEHSNLAYSVSYKKQPVINKSFLSLEFKDGSFSNNIKINKPVYTDSTEDYNLIIGKTSHVHDNFREMLLPLQSADKRTIQLAVKIFNDGVAFQYRFIADENKNNFELTDEHTTFNLPNNPVVRALLLPNYTSSHEGYYTTVAFDSLKEDTLMDMPSLFEFSNHIYLAITEAALLDYAGMYLMKHDGVLVSKLSPRVDDSSIKVKHRCRM